MAHRRDRQDDVAIDDPLVEDLAHLADPVVDSDDVQRIATRWVP